MNQSPKNRHPTGDELEPAPAKPVFPNVIQFAAMARCGDEVWIENEGQVYRLRRTRQGKLILTK